MALDPFVASARAATAEMRKVFPATPLMHSDLLSQRFGADIWLKREDLSPVRSYKLRGAFNAMRKVISSHMIFLSAPVLEITLRVLRLCVVTLA